ncbi:hypothetical protein [Halostella litorea]|uniref:hypothetical protein n=1 Tax=Halostella litorea TaxID=2528831 RepID=UPI0013869DE6|nr:hypothetical protein [Halostella litorea]
MFGVHCALDSLAGIDRRDGKGMALVKAEFATTHRQQVSLSLVLVDVLKWQETR